MAAKRWPYAILGLCVLQTGILIGGGFPPNAHAEEPLITGDPIDEAAFYDPPRLLCRTFLAPLEGEGAQFETNDATTEIGQWLQKQEEGWELFTVNFSVGQKPTGYPQGYAHVCLSPRAM